MTPGGLGEQVESPPTLGGAAAPTLGCADLLAEPAQHVNGKHDRYHVTSITGYPIHLDVGGGGKKVATIWYVLDSCNCWRVVKRFVNTGRHKGYERAVNFARHLNERERAWESDGDDWNDAA